MTGAARVTAMLGALIIAGCTSDNNGATREDTVAPAGTTLAPPNTDPISASPVPAESAIKNSPARVRTNRPRQNTGVLGRDSVIKFGDPKDPSRQMPPATQSAKDSAFKPKATIDEAGNIRPIKRDTIR